MLLTRTRLLVLKTQLNAARFRTAVWRFGTLPYAERVFRDAPEGLILQRTLFGHSIWLDVKRSNVQKLIFLAGEQFVVERAVVSSLLRRGMTVVDVGANIGYYMLLFQQCIGSKGRIVCIEPDQDNLQELRRQIEGNGFTNVEVFPVAAGVENRGAFLEPGVNARVREDGHGTRGVALRRLDSLLKSGVDLLKVDVEGYEGFVLDGAREVLQRWRPAVFLEVHPQLLEGPYSVEGIVEQLVRLGGEVEAYSISRAASALSKAWARYVPGMGVKRFTVEDLFRGGQYIQQSDPFWLVHRAV